MLPVSRTINVFGGSYPAPPLMESLCSFLRLYRENDRWFLIEAVLQRKIEGFVDESDVFYVGTMLTEDGTGEGLIFRVAPNGEKFCAMGRPNMVGTKDGYVFSWPQEWINFDGEQVDKPPTPLKVEVTSSVSFSGIQTKPCGSWRYDMPWTAFPADRPIALKTKQPIHASLVIDIQSRTAFTATPVPLINLLGGDGRGIKGTEVAPWQLSTDSDVLQTYIMASMGMIEPITRPVSNSSTGLSKIQKTVTDSSSAVIGTTIETKSALKRLDTRMKPLEDLPELAKKFSGF